MSYKEMEEEMETNSIVQEEVLPYLTLESKPSKVNFQRTLGFVGFGIVNQGIYLNLKEDMKENVIIYSLEPKYKNNLEETLSTKVNIVTINTNYDEEGSLKSLNGLIELITFYAKNSYSGILVIKSTVMPKLLFNYLDDNDINYSELRIIFWPEFLNARTAKEDFAIEIPLFGGDVQDIEELVKYLNIFFIRSFNNYQFGTWTEVMEYKYFRNMLLMNHFNFLNTVPELFETDIRRFNNFQNKHSFDFNSFSVSNDGKPGVGGACLPKDMANFIQYQYNIKTLTDTTEPLKFNNKLNTNINLLKAVQKHNNEIRGL